jgi:hypothetical protein
VKKKSGLQNQAMPATALVRRPSPLKTVQQTVLPSSRLEVVLKGYEDGLAAFETMTGLC